MSDHVTRPFNDIDGIVGQSKRHHISNWTGHWMDRNYNASARGSLNCEFKENDHFTRKRPLLGGSEIETNAHKRLVTSTQNLKTEGYNWKSESSHPPALEWTRPEAETPSLNYDLQPPETVKYYNFFEKKNFMASTSKAVPCGVNSTAPMLSMSIGGEPDSSSSQLNSKEHFVNKNFHSFSTVFIGEKKFGYVMSSGRPGALLHDPSPSNGKMFRDSTVSPQFKGKMLSQLYNPPQDIGSRGRQGVKIQLLESSTDTEEREIIRPVKSLTFGLKNESSADTKTMEMNVLQENHHSAYVTSTSNKDLKGSQASPPYHCAVASGKASSTDEKGTSSSRTQSLDMERLLSNTEQALDSKSKAWPNGFTSSDPSSRWVNRLKLTTASDSLEEPSSREKETKPFSKIMKQKTVQDQTHSHHWIRRWCHDQTPIPQKNKEEGVSLAPESIKEASDKFQKKQFPSIAAMALVGKTMNGFRPCEFRKMGSSVVWNNKGL